MANECTICLLDYNDETKTETECNHIFHQKCLDKWLQEKTSCPLCRTELKFKNSLHRPIYALPSDQYHRFNISRVDPMVLNLGIGLESIMTEPGYNAEDSIVFGREIIDEGIQPQPEKGVTLHRRENAPEMRQYQRMMMDYLLSQSHPEMLHSGSTGIIRVGSPFELNVTYADEVLITQPEEELTQVATDSLFSGGSAVYFSMMQNMSDLFDYNVVYPSSMTRTELAGEEIISDSYRFPSNEYFNNTIEEVD